MKTGQRERTIQSVDRAVAILRSLAAAPEGLSLSSLAAELNLAPQTLQSLIRTLQVHGLAAQEQKGLPYRLGPAVLTLAQRFLSGEGLSAAARPTVAALAALTGEYVLLAELQGLELTAMVEARRHQPLMVDHVRFTPDQLHMMATGKLLMAFAEPDVLTQILSRLKFIPLGRNTVTDVDQLRRQFTEIRKTNQAICIDERADHVVALAVAVRDASSAVRAALGIYLPMARYSDARGEALLKAMRRAAQDIQKVWGLVG